MGAPGQIVCKNGDDTVFIYFHWGGYEENLATIAADCLRHAMRRWDDPQYGTRMVISKALESDLLGETGIGISSKHIDEDIPAYVLDFQRQTVYRGLNHYGTFKEVEFGEFVSDHLIFAENRI